MDFLVCCIDVLQNKNNNWNVSSLERKERLLSMLYMCSKLKELTSEHGKENNFLVWQRIRKGSPKRKMHLQQRIFPSVTGSVHLTLIYSILI